VRNKERRVSFSRLREKEGARLAREILTELGYEAVLIDRVAAIIARGTTAWWWVTVPPPAITASSPADLIACHYSISLPCRPAAWNVKYGAGPSG